MYLALLMIHSLVRWLVLLALLVRGLRGVQGWLQGSDYGAIDRRLSLGALIVVHTQLVLGIVLWLVSPTIHGALADPGAAMKDGAVRLLFVEHPVAMLLGIALFTVGYGLAKRGTDARARHRNAGALSLLALVVILARIPW